MNLHPFFSLQSVYFATLLTLATYWIGLKIRKASGISFANPLLLAIIMTIAIVAIAHLDVETYIQNANIISYLLTPATVCLAVPLYEEFEKLKNNWKAIAGGILAGVITNLVTIFLLTMLFCMGHTEYVSMLPKSITTAIALALTEQYGGLPGITVAMVIITGNFGNMFAEQICALFHITEPVAIGIAIGTSSHALGTTKAIEIGQVEGAMSSLSIAVAGLLTVIFASFFVPLI
ncbi:MAG: LrgB family protein [Treponema sp.]|nr:LrgB family protein [Treponema sp.]